MEKITEVTRKDIVEIFYKNHLSCYGRLEEIEFLSRLYNLQEMPSTDSRYNNAESDIYQHRISNNDWEDDWIFYDKRFKLRNGDGDDFLLKFLCETLHPAVRSDVEEIKLLLQAYNKLISIDGYEIFEESKISNRPVFGFREIAARSTASFTSIMSQHIKPIQKILFGSPGTGKSYQIREIATEQLSISFDDTTRMLTNTVKTVFHPEYTYADFMGKLLPLTQGNSVIYKFYPGHFLRVLGMAYQGLINGNGEHYLLIIDELNRGNAAAIFGPVFQLLDREDDGWSSYEVDISEMELVGLLEAIKLDTTIHNGRIEIQENSSTRTTYEDYFKRKIGELDEFFFSDKKRIYGLLKQCRINIPRNLSIIGTINTSDESIYYLDSAFKRRWDWEYVDAPSENNIRDNAVPKLISNTTLQLDNGNFLDWYRCIVGINEFIKSHHQSIKRIEDKQIGWWFINPQDRKITLEQVKDKVMFYLWDSVFARDKKPLLQFFSKLDRGINIITYADFVKYADVFLEQMHDSVSALGQEDNLDDVSPPF